MSVADKVKSKRFNVPVTDNVVLNWLSSQSNQSVALAGLVHLWVAEHGNADIIPDLLERESELGSFSAKKKKRKATKSVKANEPPDDNTDSAEKTTFDQNTSEVKIPKRSDANRIDPMSILNGSSTTNTVNYNDLMGEN